MAKGCHVSYQAVQKWLKVGLPRTEWTGESAYAAAIEKLTDGQITQEQLLKEEPPKKRAGRPRLHLDLYDDLPHPLQRHTDKPRKRKEKECEEATT